MSDFSDYIVYVDESGDHNLVKTNPKYPIFVLAFCIFSKQEYTEHVVPRIQELKFKWFGHDCDVLHEHEIRKRLKPFDVLTPKPRFDAFMADLTQILEQAPMTVIAAVIKKEELREKYHRPANPYELGLRFCMERLALHLEGKGSTGKTHIVFECRGRQEDRDLELEFRRICDQAGTGSGMANLDIRFVDKKANSSGLQIADLIARPIGLRVLRPDQPNRAFNIIETKFRRSGAGKVKGWGLKIFP